MESSLLLPSSRPNCFQIVVQHFSEEQYIFYFAGEAPEHAQVQEESLRCLRSPLIDRKKHCAFTMLSLCSFFFCRIG